MITKLKIPKIRFKEFSWEWEEKKLWEVSKIYDWTHSTPNYVNNWIPFYSVEHLTANQFNTTKYITEEVFEKENKRVKLEKNDILMTRIWDIWTSRLLDWDVKASFYVSLSLIKQSNLFNSSFLNQYIKFSNFQKELWNKTIHVAFPKKINLWEISNCIVNFPSLPEQQKIASFLSSVDEKIEKIKEKKKNLEEYKKWVMQKIFSQEIRFKDENWEEFGGWEIKKLWEILKESNNKTTINNQYDVLSSTSNELVLQSEYFNRQIASKDNIWYKIIKRNQIVFSPQNLWLWNINLNLKYDIWIVSPSYKIFDINTNVCLVKYTSYFLKSNRMLFEYAQASEQWASIVRRNLDINSFNSIKINLPTLKEQEKIADFLSWIDEKIEKIWEELEKVEEFKKGLLQCMFV